MIHGLIVKGEKILGS